MEKRFCPRCGEELRSLGYNYDTGYIDYECDECDWSGTDVSALCEDEVMDCIKEDND